LFGVSTMTVPSFFLVHINDWLLPIILVVEVSVGPKDAAPGPALWLLPRDADVDDQREQHVPGDGGHGYFTLGQYRADGEDRQDHEEPGCDGAHHHRQ